MTPRFIWSASIVIVACSLVAPALDTLGHRSEVSQAAQAAQAATTIGVDADPSGNEAASLGRIDSCVSVSTGDTFDVDIFVTDVSDLLSWEAYFGYDMSMLEVVDREVGMFQAADGRSNVFDIAETVAEEMDGLFRLAAFDFAEPAAPDSGSGVLARVTLKAVAPGISPADITVQDVNQDGRIDLGPLLQDVDGNPIGDVNGDSYFDGELLNAQIAVDQACAGATPRPAQTPLPGFTETPTTAETGTAVTTVTGTVTATVALSPVETASPAAATASPTPPGAGGPAGEEPGNEGIPWMVVGPLIAVGAVAVVGGAFVLLRVVGR